MTQSVSRLASLFYVLAVGIAVWHFSAVASLACLGGYRGPDWQVGNSPLIIIGTIEKVEPGRIENATKYRARFESGGGKSHRTPPTIATVRIERILKGKYAAKQIRIGNGPIHNACDADYFYQFAFNKQNIFILPYYPVNGEVALEWGGSVLNMSATSMIESRVARGVAFREVYLSELRQKQPKIYDEGLRLAEELRKEAKNWPEAQYDDKNRQLVDRYQKALTDLRRKLEKVDVEAIRAALASDWLNDDSGYWWRIRLWDDAISAIEKTRAQEVDAAEEQWVRATLAHAGVETEHIDRYMAAIQKTKLHGSLCFPQKPPTDWGFFHPRDDEATTLWRTNSSDILSTDFILRYHSYDRGAMLNAYAGTLDSGVLAKINPKQVKPWVASLYRNDDERLNWIARCIITRTRGQDFVDIVLDDMVEGEHWTAWRVLGEDVRSKEVTLRFAAMMDLAAKRYDGYSLDWFWQTLRKEECFHPVCIDRAIHLLDRLEHPADGSSNTDDRPQDRIRERLIEALRGYLAAAKANRADTKSPAVSAVEYDRWFKEHPASN
jgi:hypothetical protein